LNDFELLSSEEAPNRSIGAEELAAYGIQGRFSKEPGVGLVYEVKIPITKTAQTPYAAVASKKGGYLIGLVSEKAEAQRMGGGNDNGMGGGRGGGMGGYNFTDTGGGGMGDGRMGGGMGGGRGDDMGRGAMGGSATASSIELWATIYLAEAPGT
jgi:hypothetical protein